jgi:hypothetical protein
MELPIEVQALVSELSALGEINNFLYANPQVQGVFKALYNSTREAVYPRMYQITHESLLPFALSMNGRKVRATDSWGKASEGIIEFNQFREYEGRQVQDGVWTCYIRENDVCTYKTTIGFWANTGDKYTSHMYEITNIELID